MTGNDMVTEVVDIKTVGKVYRLTSVEAGRDGLCGLTVTGARVCVPYMEVSEVVPVGNQLIWEISLN